MRSTQLVAATKVFAVLLTGVFLIGVAPAEARDRDRADICRDDFDRRVNDRRCRDYYAANGRYDRFDRRAERRFDRRNNRYDRGRRRGSEIIYRDVIPTRGRARIVVVEEIFYRRDGRRRVCTVSTRGPDGDFVPYRRLRKAARNHCSRRARVRILA
ncbi:MAG: hypothetical protein AAF224_01285 [Pseudomonadota bacterium]